MIRVLHIVHAVTRGDGLANFVMNYYRKIDRSKVQFDFLYFREAEDDFKEEITLLGGRYFYLDEPSFKRNFISEGNAFFENHKNEFAAIHCHVLFATAIYGPIAKKHGIKHVLAHSHNVGYSIGLIRKIRNYFLVKSCKYIATEYLACSPEAAIFMFGKRLFKQGKISIINNAIDCLNYQFDEAIRKKKREELHLTGKCVIGHVGGFVKQKNHKFLIEVFKEIHKNNPNTMLLLIGGEGIASGSTKKEIVNLVRDYGLSDSVLFLGLRRDVNYLMMAMDAFVFPSLYEGFGLVLVEAQASGLRCFASTKVPNESTCTELVKKISLDRSPKEWADEISTLCKYDRTINIEQLKQYDLGFQSNYLADVYLALDSKDMYVGNYYNEGSLNEY